MDTTRSRSFDTLSAARTNSYASGTRTACFAYPWREFAEAGLKLYAYNLGVERRYEQPLEITTRSGAGTARRVPNLGPR